MASSSDWGSLDVKSFAIGGRIVFRNQSRKIMSSSWILHKLRRHRHSWMWSVMWVAVFWRQDNEISTPSLYLMGSWKYCRNMKAEELKSGYLACRSSMYHLDAVPMRAHWNNLSLIESSTMLFDENHRWNIMMWFWGHSPAFPSNLGMSEGSLVGMGGQNFWWWIGSFVNRAKSCKLRRAMKWRFDPRLMWYGVAMMVGFVGA